MTIKVHKYVKGWDYSNHGQTKYEFNHTSACGFVRRHVTSKDEDVTCFYCKGEINKETQRCI